MPEKKKIGDGHSDESTHSSPEGFCGCELLWEHEAVKSKPQASSNKCWEEERQAHYLCSWDQFQKQNDLVSSSITQRKTTTEQIFPHGSPGTGPDAENGSIRMWAAPRAMLGVVHESVLTLLPIRTKLVHNYKYSFVIYSKNKVWCTHWARRPSTVLPKGGRRVARPRLGIQAPLSLFWAFLFHPSLTLENSQPRDKEKMKWNEDDVSIPTS